MPADYDILEPESAPAADFDVLEPEVERPSLRPVLSLSQFETLGPSVPEPPSQEEMRQIVEEEVARPILQIPPELIERFISPGGGVQRLFPNLTRGVAEGLSGAATITPELVLTAPTMAIPGVGPAVIAGMGAQAAGAGLGEASVGFETGQPRLVGRGLTTAGVGGMMMLPVVAPHAAPFLPKRQPPVIPQPTGGPNAVQIPSAEKVYVRPPPGDSGTVVEGVPAPGAPPGEGPVGAVAEVRPPGTAPGGGGQAPPGTPPVGLATSPPAELFEATAVGVEVSLRDRVYTPKVLADIAKEQAIADQISALKEKYPDAIKRMDSTEYQSLQQAKEDLKNEYKGHHVKTWADQEMKRLAEIEAKPTAEAVTPPAGTAPTAPAPAAAPEVQAEQLQPSAATIVQQERPPIPPSAQTKPPLKGPQQKKFVISEVQKALAEAPDEPHVIQSEGWGDLQRLKNVEQAVADRVHQSGETLDIGPKISEGVTHEVADLMQKYGVPETYPEYPGQKNLEGTWSMEPFKGGSHSADYRIQMLKERIERAQFEHGDNITIEVPGDGTFVIRNTKSALKSFLERAKKFPTKVSKVSTPEMARIEATKPPPVETSRTVETDVDAVRVFASSDQTRFVLQYVLSDGEHLVATDGRRLIVVDQKGPGTPQKPKFFDQEGNLSDYPTTPEVLERAKTDWAEAKKKKPKLGPFEGPKYPSWTQVVPEKTDLWFRNLDTERLFRLAKQALALKTDKGAPPTITIYKDAQGRIGMAARVVDVGDFAADITPTSKPLVALNAQYVAEMIQSARRLGLSKVDIRGTDELAPVTMEGRGVKMVVMPMRMEGDIPLPRVTTKIGESLGQAPEGGVGSVGPGAMSPKEAELRTAKALRGEGPPGTSPAITIPAGDMPTPVVARQNRDFTIFNNANSPQFTFWFGKLGEAAKSAWQRMAIGESTIRASVGRDIRRYVTGVLDNVPRAFRAKGGKAFFDLLDGRKLEDIEAEWTGKPGGDSVINAAREVKTRLEEIRTTIRDTKRSAYHDALMGMKKDALEDLFRKNVSEGADTSQFTKESFADALARTEFPDDWGIADGSYLPHIFSGNWRLTAKFPGAEASTFVTRAKTVAEAKARLYQYVKDNPEFAKADWSIAQDSVIPAEMIRLGDRRFWALIGKMKDQAAQEFDPKTALQGIIGRKAAKQKWFGSLKQRQGFQGYAQGFDRVMSTYLHGFHRWKELSAVQKEVQPLIEQVRAENRPAAAAELETILEHLWGKPAKSTMQFDNFIKRVPFLRDYIKPLALDRWSRNTRSLVSAGTLTTLRFGLVNRLQPLQGLYPLVGERIMAQAKIAQHTKAGKALLDEGGVTFDPGQYSLEKSSGGKFAKFREKLSGEHSNQEIAFLGMFQHGIEQGLEKPAAIQYAKLRGQLMTQFTPLLTDTPPVLRGPFASLFFQFKRFPIKQLELMGRMAADKNVPGLARWFGTIALMGGAQYFLRQFLVPNSVRKEVHDALVNELGKGAADVAMYGLPGLIGADISGSLTLGDEPFGQNLYEKVGRQLTGPGVSLTYETAKAAMTPRRTATTKWQEAESVLRRYPTARPAADAIALMRVALSKYPNLKPIGDLIGLEAGDVDLHTPDGEIRYRRTVGDAIRGLGSLRSTSESKVALYTDWMLGVSKEIQDLKNGLYVASMREGGDTTKALDAIYKFNARWPEFAIRADEAREYLKYRGKGSGKTDVQRRAGRRFGSALSEIEQEE